MAKQVMEAQQFAKRMVLIYTVPAAAVVGLNGWLLLREAAGKQPVSAFLSLGAACALFILLWQLWAWHRAAGPSRRKAIAGRRLAQVTAYSMEAAVIGQLVLGLWRGRIEPGWELLPVLLLPVMLALPFELCWKHYWALREGEAERES